MLGQPVLDADPAGRRLQAHRQAAARAPRHRPGAHRHPDAPRAAGVVGKFVEFFGPALASLPLADRATIANMCARVRRDGRLLPRRRRDAPLPAPHRPRGERRAPVEAYTKAQGLFRTDETPEPVFTDVAGARPRHRRAEHGRAEAPAGPHRRSKADMKARRRRDRSSTGRRVRGRAAGRRARRRRHTRHVPGRVRRRQRRGGDRRDHELHEHLEPEVMVAPACWRRRPSRPGLNTKPWVKTSLAPGSKVVTDYLDEAGLRSTSTQLGFYLVGYGCTTCIGNSGPLPEEVAARRSSRATSSSRRCSRGNRNFEGAHPQHRCARTTSPRRRWSSPTRSPAASTSTSTTSRSAPAPTASPSTCATSGRRQAEVADAHAVGRPLRDVHEGVRRRLRGRRALARTSTAPTGDLFAWDADSTYIRKPAVLRGHDPRQPPGPRRHQGGARARRCSATR